MIGDYCAVCLQDARAYYGNVYEILSDQDDWRELTQEQQNQLYEYERCKKAYNLDRLQRRGHFRREMCPAASESEASGTDEHSSDAYTRGALPVGTISYGLSIPRLEIVLNRKHSTRLFVTQKTFYSALLQPPADLLTWSNFPSVLCRNVQHV